MANPVVADVRDTVSRATTVVESATALVKGINGLLAAAKAEAIKNGATEEELAPVQTLIDEFDVKVASLASAVAEHTPSEPNPVTE